MFSVYNILSASLLLILFTPCIRAHPSQNNWEDKENLETFQKLLEQVDPPSLHEALHTFSPKKFKHGMFQEDRTAVEVIHKEEPSIATSIVNLARRQKREVVDLAKRVNDISNGTTTTTSAAINPQSTSTRVTPVPQRSDSSTPVGSTTETSVSSAGNSPITTTSTSTSSNGTPVPGSTISSNGTPVPGSTSSSNGTPVPGSTSPSTTSAQAAATTSAASPTPTSTSISVSLTAGQLVTTTNGVGLVVISTVGGGVSTVSPTGSMTSMAAHNAAAQTSVVVQTSTLPNGSKSVVTAVTVVGGSNPAVDTPTGAAGVASTTSASNPSLQTGEAVMTRGWGKEMVLVVGGAVVFAGMM